MTIRSKGRLGTRSARRRGIVLPNDACPTCGTMMRRVRARFSLPINGEEIAVSRTPHLRCPKCGEIVIGYEDDVAYHRAALAIYRQKYGLLSAEEIRAIRGRYGLTQADLARLLRLGENTLSRWEAGRNVQTAAMDVLLRMLRDLPGSVKYLRRRAA